jgi:glycosyltransferase involved in cell wall biosynthesis
MSDASQRLRVAVVGDRGIPARYSGFSTLVEQLAPRLVNDYGLDVTVYCRSHYYDDRSPMYRGVHRVFLPAPGGKNFESIVHSNLAMLHAALRGFDVVIVADPGNAPFGVPLWLRRTPTVYLTDGLGWQRRKWGKLQRRYYRWSEAVCARIATWLVTDSREMQRYYRTNYRADSTFIPYSGDVGDPPDAAALARFGVVAGGYYLVVARIEPENNVDLIIREYRASGVSRPLVVVGSSPYGTPYARAIADEADEKVLCLGGIFDSAALNALYANCYAYLHGHEVGGTNPSLLRAMHGGAACIPIDVVFHREVVGADAPYFGTAPGSLSAILASLDSDAAEVARLGAAAQARVDALYRWDAVAAAYADLVREIAAARREGRDSRSLTGVEMYRPEDFAGQEPPLARP